MYDVLSSRKKKLKGFPSLKFRCSKSEICRPPLLEIGSSWARYFRSGNSIVPSQLPIATEEEATQLYAEQIAV